MISTNNRSLEYLNLKKSSGIHAIENIKGLYLLSLALPLIQIAALLLLRTTVTTIPGKVAFTTLILLIGLTADALTLYTRYYIQRSVGHVPTTTLWCLGAALLTKLWFILCT